MINNMPAITQGGGGGRFGGVNKCYMICHITVVFSASLNKTFPSFFLPFLIRERNITPW